MNSITITHDQYKKDIISAVGKINKPYTTIFGIPRGGYYAATIVSQETGIPIILNPAEITKCTLLVDDLVDSGATAKRWMSDTGCDLLAVYATAYDKATYVGALREEKSWLVFPDESGCGIEDNFRRTLQYIGEDVSREGLLETPTRMRRAYDEIFAGYKTDPRDLVKTFVQGTCQEIVILKDCEFYSTCEHHFFPFFGKCSIGYLPKDKVIGVSKLARLLDCFSKRMQIQERMTSQIADFLETELGARGVYVVCEGVHFCMTSRGIKKQSASMVTSAIRGEFKADHAMRSEFLSLIGK